MDDMAGKIELRSVSFANNDLATVRELSATMFSVAPVDTDSNGKYDQLVVTVDVDVTDQPGLYRIEGLLVDEAGTPIAWSVSDPQALVVGTDQQMLLAFDGTMLYDQLRVGSSTKTFSLVAVKIFSDHLSASTLQAEVAVAASYDTPPITGQILSRPAPAQTLFADDMETDASKWSLPASLWTRVESTWRSWSHSFVAGGSSQANASLTAASSIDLSNYAGPAIRFNNAYRMLSS